MENFNIYAMTGLGLIWAIGSFVAVVTLRDVGYNLLQSFLIGILMPPFFVLGAISGLLIKGVLILGGTNEAELEARIKLWESENGEEE